MSETLTFYRLQQIDTHLDRVRSELRAIQKTLEDDVEVSRARQAKDSAQAEYESSQKEVKGAETELQDQRIKIDQTEASLYGGTVRNPKELQDLQNDVASLKRYLLTLEDRLLAAMERAENSESELHHLASVLADLQHAREIQNLSLVERQQVLEKELETHQLERQAVAAPLSPQGLSLYENLRQERRGVAVAVILENACAACGSTLTAAQVQVARSPLQIAYCPSCGRILYGS